jgi:hypothetical protein
VALRLPPIAISAANAAAAAALLADLAKAADAADPTEEKEPEVLPEGWVIDTPGIRSFGLAHIGPNGVIAAFPDLAAVTAECPRGCTHAADAPDCALDPWLASLGEDTSAHGAAQFATVRARVDSVRRLLSALNPQPPGAHAE